MRRITLACLIALFAICSCAGLSSCKRREAIVIDGYRIYENDEDNTCTIVGLPSNICEQSTWSIPEKIGQYTVTQVGELSQGGFLALPQELITSFGHVRKMTIPASVKTIRAEYLDDVLIFETDVSPSNFQLYPEDVASDAWWLSPQEEVDAVVGYKYLTEENFIDNLVYIIEESEEESATLLCALGSGEVTIPQTFKGLPITKIAERAFYRGLYTSVTIEENIVEIGPEAFLSSKIGEVLLPANCEEIPQGMFQASALNSIDLPNSVKKIADSAFLGSNLTDISFPDALTTIGVGAFSNCWLTEVTLPASVTEIGNSAFQGCPLTFVDLSETKLTTISNSMFEKCPLTDRVILPDTITSIQSGAFSDTELTSFTFPLQLKEIEGYAFNRVQLKDINLPNQLESIGDNAFGYNLALTELRLPDSCLDFNGNAVSGCTNLKTLHLNNVESCSYIPNELNLTKFTVSDTNEVLYIKDDILYRKNANGTHRLIKCLEITPCESITLENCLISPAAFYDHPTLKEVTIIFQGFEYEVPNAAFYGCAALEKVVLPNVDKIEIGADAFLGCTSLSQINTEKVGTFGYSSFEKCSSLSEVDFTSATLIVSSAFNGCDLREVHTYHVARIGINAFANNVNLTKVTLENCYDVDARAFKDCKRLTSFSCDSAEIDEDAFDGTPLALTKGCKNPMWARFF